MQQGPRAGTSAEVINGPEPNVCKHYTYCMNVGEKKAIIWIAALVWFKMSPGLQRRYQVHSLSIHIKRETNFTNRAVCVHMSLSNSSINIQCFHYRQERRARSLRRSSGVLRGREKSCTNSTLRIISREKSVNFFHFHWGWQKMLHVWFMSKQNDDQIKVLHCRRARN